MKDDNMAKSATRRVRRTASMATLVLVLVAGAAGLGTLAASSAALTDFANLNLGSAGIGSTDRFDIGVVKPGDLVEQADGPNGFDWVVPDSQTLAPGHSVTTTIPVFNNSPRFGADVTMTVVTRGDGSVGSAPNITGLLRFTARLEGGGALFTDQPLASATAGIGNLAARGAAALADGAAYTAGATGSEQRVILTITYLDEPGVEDYNGGLAALAVRFAGESTTS